MPHGPKIATCTYCGTRAALVLDSGRHELACSACGAPLHDLKRLPADRVEPRPVSVPKGKPRPPVHATPLGLWERAARDLTRKKKKPKARKALKKALDLLDDIFD